MGAASVVLNQSQSRGHGMMQMSQIFLFSIFVCGNIRCHMLQSKYPGSLWTVAWNCVFIFRIFPHDQRLLVCFRSSILVVLWCTFPMFGSAPPWWIFFADCGGNRQVTSQPLQASICSQAITARHMHSLSHHFLLRPPTLTPLLPHLL